MKALSQRPADQEEPLTKQHCPACTHSEAVVFFEAQSVPVFCNTLWETRGEAMAAPVAPIRLAYCQQCTLIYNVAFDQRLTEYSAAYENSLHFSPVFQQWAQETAERLVGRYQLHDKFVIEIGCGQGDFLALMQRLGNNRVLGFDPSYDSTKSSAIAERSDMEILARSYSRACEDYPADFICCRHVLEHVERPLEFLKTIRTAIGQREACVVYFEVPNALYSLERGGLWDIIYEHCSYFTSESLANFFLRAGFEPIEIAQRYGGQFLTIEARPAYGRPGRGFGSEWTVLNIRQLAADFHHVYQSTTRSWRDKLADLCSGENRVVIWGAGSKGASFVNALSVSHQQIEYIVDVNPRKSGRFVPRTGQRVVTPDFLKEYRPQTIIIMNPLYENEIRRTVREFGLGACFLLAQQDG